MCKHVSAEVQVQKKEEENDSEWMFPWWKCVSTVLLELTLFPCSSTEFVPKQQEQHKSRLQGENQVTSTLLEEFGSIPQSITIVLRNIIS